MGPDDVVPDEEREVEPVVDDLDPGAHNPPVDPVDAEADRMETIPEPDRPA